MEMISLDGKSNFFEKRVSEYRIANIGPYQGGSGLNSTGENIGTL